MRVGEPVPFELDEDPRVVTERLMVAITELVGQAARTYPQGPAGSEDRWWLPRHLGGTAPTMEADERRQRRGTTGPR